MKKVTPIYVLFIVILLLGMAVNLASAQDATATETPATQNTNTTSTTTTTSGPSNSLSAYVVICEDSAVINLEGTLLIGWDVYYQVFSGPDGTGTPLTSFRQVEVGGNYAFSEIIKYSGGTVPTGSTASVHVRVARDNDSSRISQQDTINDIQDGCNTPLHLVGESIEAGQSANISESTGGSGSGYTGTILSPFGGTINNTIVTTPEADVVIGARASDGLPARSDTPGVIFAECNQNLPAAAPGLLYDNDNIVIFWSWYAKTEEQLYNHIQNANYGVTLNRAPLSGVTVSQPTKRGDNYWVFYTAQIGNLSPGNYGVDFKLDWDRAITDGYSNFGPGTEELGFTSSCGFRIRPNTSGDSVYYNQMYSLR